MRAKFRVRFRMPYFNYLELLQWIGDDTHFARWRGAKSNNKMSSPIKLMVLVHGRFSSSCWHWHIHRQHRLFTQHTTHHTVLKAAPGAAIFRWDMLFDIPFVADWKQIGEYRQSQTDHSNTHENNKWVDYKYKIGDKILIRKDGIPQCRVHLEKRTME
jgi:hypothetical protein